MFSSELVTVVVLENWFNNACAFVRDMQIGDSWYLAIIGPRPVMFFKTKEMYFKFKINY